MKVERTYKHIAFDRDRHGNMRVYLRVPGRPKIRLRHEPGSAEFDAEYQAALIGKIDPKRPRRPPILDQQGFQRCQIDHAGAVHRKDLGGAGIQDGGVFDGGLAAVGHCTGATGLVAR